LTDGFPSIFFGNPANGARAPAGDAWLAAPMQESALGARCSALGA
jgi:hypothetical protein